MPRIFTHEIQVPADAIDELGHVSNLVYLHWMQDVAIRHSTARGWGMDRYLGDGAIWVVRSHFIEYRRPAFEGDQLTVLTWIAGFGPRSCTRKYLCWRAADARVIARAETQWAYVELATGQPRRIPDTLRGSFEVVADPDEALALVRGTAVAADDDRPVPPLSATP